MTLPLSTSTLSSPPHTWSILYKDLVKSTLVNWSWQHKDMICITAKLWNRRKCECVVSYLNPCAPPWPNFGQGAFFVPTSGQIWAFLQGFFHSLFWKHFNKYKTEKRKKNPGGRDQEPQNNFDKNLQESRGGDEGLLCAAFPFYSIISFLTDLHLIFKPKFQLFHLNKSWFLAKILRLIPDSFAKRQFEILQTLAQERG